VSKVRAISELGEGVLRWLFGQHNITPGGLKIADKAGGLSMPSIAISRADTPLEKFGEITLMANPDLVTPSRTTRVWPNDAYTGRQPRSETYFANKKDYLRNIASDPDLGHLRDIGYAHESLGGIGGGVDDFDKRLREIQAAQELGIINPSDYDNMGDLWMDSMQALRQVSDASREMAMKNAGGLSRYAELQEMLPRGYSPSGNRLKPVPYTIENVFKQMKKEGAGFAGGENFIYGAPSFRAEVSYPFDDLADIKANRGRIYSPDAMMPVKDQFDEDVMDVASLVAGELGGDGGMRGIDDALAYMTDFAKTGRRPKWSDKDISPEAQERIKEVAHQARNMATEYFEAKPRRIVQLSEFAGAMIPDGLPPETEQILKKHGIERIFKYGENEDRASLLHNFKDLMFSLAPYAIISGVAGGALTEDGEL